MLSRTNWALAAVAASVAVALMSGLEIEYAAAIVVAVAFAVFVPLRSLPHELRRLTWTTSTSPKAWIAAAAAFLTAVAAMHALGSPEYSYDCAWRAYRRCRTGQFWATTAFAAGVAAAAISVSYLPAYRLVTDGEKSSAADAHEGRVVVTGEVEAADDLLEAPFSGEDCVCTRYAVQERYNERLFSDDGSWHTVAAGETVTPFYVDDGSDRLLVDPNDGYLTLNDVTSHGPVGDVAIEENADDGEGTLADGDGYDDAGPEREDAAALDAVVSSGRVYRCDTEIEVAADEEPPERVERWRRENTGVLPLLPRSRRYQESLLRPGDAVTVAGDLRLVSHGYPERRVVGADDAAVKVAAGDAHDVSMWLTGAVWVGGAIAILLTPVGLAGMYLTL